MRWLLQVWLLVGACGATPASTSPSPVSTPSLRNDLPKNGYDAQTVMTAMTRATKELDCSIPRLTWRQLYAQGTRSQGEVPSAGSDALTIQIDGCARRATYTCINFAHLIYETGHSNICIRELDVVPLDAGSAP